MRITGFGFGSGSDRQPFSEYRDASLVLALLTSHGSNRVW
jgi:hypothetical protein